MDAHKFIEIFEQLTSTQHKILRKLLVGETDEQIANSFHIAKSTVRKHVENICKAFELQKNIGKQYSKRAELVALFSQYKPELINPNQESLNTQNLTLSVVINPKIDWGEAPNISVFYGRNHELNTLSQWILNDQCRLVALLGMGGMGKTALASKLAQKICPQFDYIIWRSLRETPKIEDILTDIIKFIFQQQEIVLPDTLGGKITRLIHYLKIAKCLLILDNVESIMQGDNYVGEYLTGYEGYGDLFARIGESFHQSCLVITSREKPKEITLLEAISDVCSWQLTGLNAKEGQSIFTKYGSFFGSDDEWKAVIQTYDGNPLALKFAAVEIQEALNGNISNFVKNFLNEGQVIFNNIRKLLEGQFHRLSDLEKDIMYWLAINREPCSILELQADIISSLPQPELLEALASLRRRTLIEKNNEDKFSLQNVVMEYITDKLIGEVYQEIQTEHIQLLNSHALIKAQSKDYVREAQIRLILNPIKENLLLNNGSNANDKLIDLIARQKQNFYRIPSYLAGNIINLLCQLSTELTNYDFSNLAIWQAYLKDTSLHSVNFSHCDLSKSVFAETLSRILTVAFSPNGDILATGDTNGEISLWLVTTGKKLANWQAHQNWIRSVAFSPDGTILASGSKDKTIKLWNTNNYQCLQTLKGHTDEVWSVVFNPKELKLASGSNDKTVRIWNLETKECRIWQQHTQQVQSVAFNFDGTKLASGSEDKTIRIWDMNTGKCERVLEEHTGRVWSVAFHPDNLTLASSSDDQTIRVWDLNNGNCLHILKGHSGRIWSVTFSPSGNKLASGSGDETVKIWNTNTGDLLENLHDNNHRVRCVAFSPDETILVSGCDTQTLKLWDTNTGKCLRTLRGYTSWVRAVSFSPDGQKLASGSNDQTVRLWDIHTGECLTTLRGHRSWVRSVSFSPDGKKLASGSNDKTIKLWDISRGKCLKTLIGHKDWIWWITFSPDGEILFSSSDDRTVKIWDVNSGECLKTWQPLSSWIWSMALSPNGKILATGDDDYQVRLWDIDTQQCQHICLGHSLRVQAVAFSQDGKTLASGSDDGIVRLWDVNTGEFLQELKAHSRAVRAIAYRPDDQLLATSSDDQTIRLWDFTLTNTITFTEHTQGVESISFSSQDPVLASSSEDETIKIWDLQTGECRKTLKIHRLYEGINISYATGLNQAQKETMIVLGATITVGQN
ncbi:MAG: NB-ARC domain-containing protein [Cuspidothrix sp.]